MIRRHAFAALVTLLAPSLATLALAGPKTPTDSPVVDSGPTCDLTQYKGAFQNFAPAMPIPDNDPVGLTVGPLSIPADGTQIDDVIAAIQMSHTWVGDLIVTLSYFSDCASATAVASTHLLCRPRGTFADTPAPCGPGADVGCSGDLSCGNTYYFSDQAPAPIAEGSCASLYPGGCYQPAIGNAMAVFRGLAKGGCFRLTISDNAPADLGTICSWAVYTANQGPVAARAGSWGQLKAIYR